MFKQSYTVISVIIVAIAVMTFIHPGIATAACLLMYIGTMADAYYGLQHIKALKKICITLPVSDCKFEEEPSPFLLMIYWGTVSIVMYMLDKNIPNYMTICFIISSALNIVSFLMVKQRNQLVEEQMLIFARR